MDYKGWVLSIYDKYIESYNKKYPIKNNNNLTFKEKGKGIFLNEDSPLIIVSILYFIIMAIFTTLVLLKEMYPVILSIFTVLGTCVELVLVYAYKYKHEMELKSYREKIEVLREILYEESLYNKNFIMKLIDYTGSIFYKIKSSKITAIFNVLVTAGVITYTGDFFKKVDKKTFGYFILGLLLFIIIIYGTYLVSISIPKNRIIRKQYFHELLKILFDYDPDCKITNDTVNNK